LEDNGALVQYGIERGPRWLPRREMLTPTLPRPGGVSAAPGSAAGSAASRGDRTVNMLLAPSRSLPVSLPPEHAQPPGQLAPQTGAAV